MAKKSTAHETGELPGSGEDVPLAPAVIAFGPDPFAGLDLAMGLQKLLDALPAAVPGFAAARLRLAAYAGHRPAARALEAAGLESDAGPSDPDKWCAGLGTFGSLPRLRAAYAVATQVLPSWETAFPDDPSPRVALTAVAGWFDALRPATRRRSVVGTLDPWLALPEGSVVVACLEAARDAEEAAARAMERWRTGDGAVFAAAHAGAAAARVARFAAGSGPPALLGEAFAFAAISFLRDDGAGESRAAIANSQSKAARRRCLPFAKQGVLELALAPLHSG